MATNDGGKNWAAIRRMFLNAVGETTGAVQEWADHVTNGYRDVASRISLQALEDDDSAVTVSGQDYVTLPGFVFHVITIHDDTNGVKLVPEEGGMRGRNRFLAVGTGKPALGKPRYYAITENTVYLRPTPDGIYSLKFKIKVQPTAVSDVSLALFPLTPAHLDMAIVYAAARSYHLLHPDTDVAPENGRQPSDRMKEAFDLAMAEPQLPKDRERFDGTGRVYIRGFRLGRRR